MATGLLGLLGRAGLGLAKTGARKGLRTGSKIVKGIGSTLGPGASRILKGAKASGTRGRPSVDPLQRVGRSGVDIGRAIPGVGKEAVTATTKGLQSLWASILAKAPNKVAALKEFRTAAAKQFPNSANLVNSSIALIKQTGGAIGGAPWAAWGAKAVEQAGRAATGAGNLAGRAGGAAPKFLARSPAERQAMNTVKGKVGEQAARIGSAIKDRAPALSGGIVNLGNKAKSMAGTVGSQAKSIAGNIGSKIPKLGPAVNAPNASLMGGGMGGVVGSAAARAAPRVSGIANAGVANPIFVGGAGTQPAGAGIANISRGFGTPKAGVFASYMDKAAAQGIAGPAAAAARAKAGFGEYMGASRAGAGGAGGAGIWSDGTLRGIDRLLLRGIAAPFVLGGKALKYPGILGATGLGVGAYYGLKDDPTPSEQMRKGIYSLAGNEKNMGRSLQDLGTLYAAGQIGGALGGRNAEGLSSQLMGNYIGGELFGEEGFPNIPSRAGLNYAGGTPEGIFQNPAQDAIKARFGNEMMDDEQILKRYSEVLDKVRKQKTLSSDDINFMMMFEALNKPTNLPTDRFESNAGLLNAMARNDVQNQFGGRFEVIDPNALYPTWQQPRVPINAASGGEATGPGTGTSDSIPARLSDGEFVMTADAVRNAGNGSRKEGVRKMYELMNNLEAR